MADQTAVQPGNLERLYENLSKKDGFTVPLDQFKVDMQDENNLKKLHENLSKKDGFNVPYENFKTDMWGEAPKMAATPVVPEAPITETGTFDKIAGGVNDFASAVSGVPGMVANAGAKFVTSAIKDPEGTFKQVKNFYTELPKTVPALFGTVASIAGQGVMKLPQFIVDAENQIDPISIMLRHNIGEIAKEKGWSKEDELKAKNAVVSPGTLAEKVAAGDLANSKAAKWLTDQAKELESKSQVAEGKSIIDLAHEGNYGTALGKVGVEISRSLPYTVTALLGGGAGLMAMGLTTASTEYDNIKDKDVAQSSKIINATLNGVAEALGEYIGTQQIGKFIGKGFQAAGKGAQSQVMQQGLEAYMSKLFKKYGLWAQSTAEGVSEWATTIAQNASAKYSGVDPSRNITDGAMDSFIVGAAQGGIMGGGGQLINSMMGGNSASTQIQGIPATPPAIPPVQLTPRQQREQSLRQFHQAHADRTTGMLRKIDEVAPEGEPNKSWFVTQEVDGGEGNQFFLVEDGQGGFNSLSKKSIAENNEEITEISEDDYANTMLSEYDLQQEVAAQAADNTMIRDGRTLTRLPEGQREYPDGEFWRDEQDQSMHEVPTEEVTAWESAKQSGIQNPDIISRTYGKTQVTGTKDESGNIVVSEPYTIDDVNSLISEVQRTTGGKSTVKAEPIPSTDATLPESYKVSIVPTPDKLTTNTATPTELGPPPADAMIQGNVSTRKVVTQKFGATDIDIAEDTDFDEVVPSEKVPLEKALPILEKKFKDNKKYKLQVEKSEIEIPGETKYDDPTFKTVVKSIRIVPITAKPANISTQEPAKVPEIIPEQQVNQPVVNNTPVNNGEKLQESNPLQPVTVSNMDTSGNNLDTSTENMDTSGENVDTPNQPPTGEQPVVDIPAENAGDVSSQITQDLQVNGLEAVPYKEVKQETATEVTKELKKEKKDNPESIFREQKKQILDDLRKAEDILFGSKLESARKQEQEWIDQKIPRDKIDSLITSDYEYNAENLPSEAIKDLEKAGIKIEEGKFVIDVYRDGTIKIGDLRTAMRITEKGFPAKEKTYGNLPTLSNPKAKSIAQGLKSQEDADRLVLVAEKNIAEAEKGGLKGMIELTKRQLQDAKDVQSEAKRINYPEYLKNEKMNADEEFKKFRQQSYVSRIISDYNLNYNQLYDLVDGRDYSGFKYDDLYAIVIADNIKRKESSFETEIQSHIKKRDDYRDLRNGVSGNNKYSRESRLRYDSWQKKEDDAIDMLQRNRSAIERELNAIDADKAQVKLEIPEETPTSNPAEIQKIKQQFGINDDGTVGKLLFQGVKDYSHNDGTGGVKVAVADKESLHKSYQKLKLLSEVLNNEVFSNTVESIRIKLDILDRIPKLREENEQSRKSEIEALQKGVKNTDTHGDAFGSGLGTVRAILEDLGKSIKELNFEVQLEGDIKKDINYTADKLADLYKNGQYSDKSTPLLDVIAEGKKKVEAEKDHSGEANDMIKQPWEMTRKEWELLPKFKQNIKSKNFGLPTDKQEKYTPYDYIGTYSKDRDLHKEIIKQAISEGKTIPEEVLNDYPQLKPQNETTKEAEGQAREEGLLKANRIVRDQLKGRVSANMKDLNNAMEALNKEGLSDYTYQGDGDKNHIAEIIADENLKNAPIEIVGKELARLNKEISAQDDKLESRMNKGRDQGGTAGALNRDIYGLGITKDGLISERKRIQKEIDRRNNQSDNKENLLTFTDKRYNSTINAGEKYYDNRYGDYYTIESMVPFGESDVEATLKYDKGTTRKEKGSFLLYHIDAKQHSLKVSDLLSGETVKNPGDTQVLEAPIEQILEDGKKENEQKKIVQSIKEPLSETDNDTSDNKELSPEEEADGLELAKKLQDFGEKIGAARKDTAESGFKRGSKEDEGPAWAKKYKVFKTDSKFIGEDQEYTGTYDLAITSGNFMKTVKRGFKTYAEAKRSIPLFEVSINHRIYPSEKNKEEFSIYRRWSSGKMFEIKKGFKSKEEAQRYLVTNTLDVINHKTAKVERPHLDKIERIGLPERKGNVTPEKFMQDFGLRGGEFGNWVAGDERQTMLNMAYDAFSDMANVLGIEPNAISLNGRLAIGFGSRGQGLGSAAAHYEPSRGVINLTKMSGAGALAHEWFHAFDSYFGFKGKDVFNPNEAGVISFAGNPSDDYLSSDSFKPREYIRTEGGKGVFEETVRPEVVKAWKAVWDAMRYKTEQSAYDKGRAEKRRDSAVESLMNGLNSAFGYLKQDRTYGLRKKAATPEQIKRWDALIEKVNKFDFGEVSEKKTKKRWAFEKQYGVQKQLNELFKEIAGREMSTYNMSYNNFKGIELYNEEIKRAEQGETFEHKVATTFYRDSKEIDKTRASDYWSTNHEMSARGFEAFMDDMIKQAGGRNDYLVHSVNNAVYQMLYDAKPYPEGVERTAINEAFKNLFNVIETKEDNGNSVMFSKASTTGFYSTIENSLEKIQQNKGTVEQFRAMLLKNGAKQAELDWMGFDDHFEDKLAMVTKGQVQEWIDQNKIEVKEVEKGKGLTDSEVEVFKILTDKWWDGTINTEENIQREELSSRKNNENTKFSQYVEPGGENYKELLLTMPSKESQYRKRYEELRGKESLSDAEQKEYSELVNSDRTDYAQTFKSSHYDEPNILAHVRFNEREVNGEKVLFVEEFQSDWAQKGKKDGFKGNDKIEIKPSEIYDGMFAVYSNGIKRQDGFTKPGADSYAGSLIEKINSGVPSMPFSKTDQWVNLAFRRMMKYAVDNGFDRIAWTNGEMQANRYDLSKQVDEVRWEQTDKIKPDGKYYIYTYKDGVNQLLIRGAKTTSEIEDILGKDIAKQISESGKDKGSLTGQQLSVGGAGMRGFYDSIIPSAANKLGKQFGAKVENIGISFGDPIENDINPFRLTAEMYNGTQEDFPGYEEAEVGEWIIRDENGNHQLTLAETEAPNDLAAVQRYYDIMDENGEPVRVNNTGTQPVQSIPITDSMRQLIPNGQPMFSLIGQRGAENIEGLIDNLTTAKAMTEAGKDKQAVFIATGWEKFPDGWKYDLPDGDLLKSFDEIVNLEAKDQYFTDDIPLNELLSSDDLFNAYPELKEYKVRFYNYDTPIEGQQKDAYSSSEGKIIGIGIGVRDDIPLSAIFSRSSQPFGAIRKGGAYDRNSVLGLLLHEAQHIIQGLENFGRGSNAEDSWRAAVKKKMEEHREKGWYEDQTDALKTQLAEDAVLKDENSGVKKTAGFKLYKRAAGEVEARNVQSRLNLSPEERKQQLISATQDVSEDQKIYLMEAIGKAFSDNNAVSAIESLQAGDPQNKPVHYKGRKAIIKYLESNSKFTKQTIDKVKNTEFMAIQIGDEVFINSDNVTSSDEAVKYWIHERFHVQLIEDIPNGGERRQFLNDLYRRIGKAEIQRVVPESYWNDPIFTQAEEYLTHLAEQLADNGAIENNIDPETKTLILDTVNKFTTLKNIQDAKNNRTSLPEGGNRQRTEDLGKGDGRTIQSNAGINGRGEPDIRGSLRSNDAKKQNPLGLESLISEGKRVLSEAKQSLSLAKSEGIPPTIPVNGIQRPTTNSKGQLIHPTREGIENFYKWFGDSKVVDDQGKPLVVYHGTHVDFDIFKSTKFPTAGYFSEDVAYAKSFARISTRYRNGKENVKEVYLNISNPIDFSEYPGDKEYSSVELKEMFDIFKNKNIDWRIRRLWEWAGEEDVISIIKESGHDGITFNEMTVDFWKENDFDNEMADLKTVKSHIAFTPNQIKSATGNDGSFSPNDNNINFARVPLLQYVQNARQNLNPKPNPEKVRTATGRFRTLLQDSRMSVKNLQTKFGLKVVDHTDVSMAINQKGSKSMGAVEKFEEDHVVRIEKAIATLMKEGKEYSDISKYALARHAPERNKSFIEKEATGRKPYKDAIKLAEELRIQHKKALTDGDLPLAAALAAKAQKAKDKAAQIKADAVANQDFDDDNYSGFTTNEATDLFDQFERDVTPQAIKDFWDAINGANAQRLKYWSDYGRFNKSTVEAIEGTNWKYYVPMAGWEQIQDAVELDYEKDSSGEFAGAKRAKGRTSMADDPIANMINMSNSAILWGEKNRVKQTLYRLIKSNPNREDLFTMAQIFTMTDNLGQTVEVVYDKGGTYTNPEGDEMPDYIISTYEITNSGEFVKNELGLKSELEKDHTFSATMSNEHLKGKARSKSQQHEVDVFVDGRSYKMILRDPSVSNTVNGTNMYRPVWGLAHVNRLRSQLVTTFAPIFTIKNTIRDFKTATSTKFIEEGLGSSLQFVKTYAAAAKYMAYNLANAEAVTPEEKQWKKYYEEYRQFGSRTGHSYLLPLDVVRENLSKEISRIKNGTSKKFKPYQVLRLLEITSAYSESIARFTAYVNARREGDSVIIATSKAKEITTNFDTKGTIAPLAGSFIMFFNPAVQGATRQMNLAKHHPGRYAINSAWGIAQGFIFAMLWDAMNGDDDDEDRREISKYTKRTNTVVGFSEHYLIIPLAQGFRLWNGLGSILYEISRNKTTPLQAAKDVMEIALESISPVDLNKMYDKNGELSLLKTSGALFNAIQPLTDVAVNENFMGLPIAREPFTKAQEGRQADSQLYKNNVNLFLKSITDWWFIKGGGDPKVGSLMTPTGERIANRYDWNPSKIEHVIKSYTGVLGSNILDGINLLATSISEDAAKKVSESSMQTEGFDWNKVPIVNSFYKSKYKGKASDEFREIYNYATDLKYTKDAVKRSYGPMQGFSADDNQFINQVYTAKKKIDEMIDRKIKTQNRIDIGNELSSDRSTIESLNDQILSKQREIVSKYKNKIKK